MKFSEEYFAENLVSFRKRNGFSQKDIAEKLNCSEKTVSKWECGNAVPAIDTLFAIASIFHTNIEGLFAKETTYCLGIDGGGTKTALVLADEEMNIIRKIKADCCNPMDIGFEKASAILENAIYEICGDIPFSKIYLFAGIAGATSGDMNEKFKVFFQKFGFGDFVCDTDNRNIITAGIGDDDGISVILGTGVCAFIQKNKVHSRVAGWGYLIDNGGSAYNLGRDALNAYFTAFDGSGEKTALTEEIDSFYPGGAQNLMAYIYSGGKKVIASFAPTVFAALEKGDSVAQRIFEANMKEVSHIVETAAKKLDCEKIPVVLAGGLTNQPLVMETLIKYLKNPEKYNIKILDKEPVMGALMLAEEVKKNA